MCPLPHCSPQRGQAQGCSANSSFGSVVPNGGGGGVILASRHACGFHSWRAGGVAHWRPPQSKQPRPSGSSAEGEDP